MDSNAASALQFMQDSYFLQQLSVRFANMQEQLRERDAQIHLLRSDGAGPSYGRHAHLPNTFLAQ